MVDVANVLKAFGETTRLRILRLIDTQELAVNELVESLRMPQSRISRHLAVLRQAEMVADRREGNWIYYHVDAAGFAPPVRALWEAIREHVGSPEFFPEDLSRLQEALSRRKARSKSYFDAVVSEWDRIKRSYIDDKLSFLVLASLVRPDAVAVDVGTGTGEILFALARTAARVIGVDSSAKMLEVCRSRLAQSGLKNVELRLGDAELLPLADEECDTAFSSMLLHHLADPGAGVREMARVVKGGGKVFLSDLVKHEYDWTREVMADLWLGFTEEQVRQWMSAAGFVDVTYAASALPSPREAAGQEKLGVFIATGVKPGGSRRP